MTVLERLKKVLDVVFEGEIDSSVISGRSDLRRDTGMNSISMLYMVMGIEAEFHIKFSNDDLAGMKTVQDVVDCIERKAQ